MSGKCSHGFTTARARADWLNAKGIAATKENASLVANPDESTPLFFWQLHSVLGYQKIEAIVSPASLLTQSSLLPSPHSSSPSGHSTVQYRGPWHSTPRVTQGHPSHHGQG
jgi:hypothetical protein